MYVLKTALVQMNTTVGDLEGNSRRVADHLEQLKKNNVSLAVFPELTITGYPPEDLLLRPGFIDNSLKAVQSILPHTFGITAVIGSVYKDEGLYNAAFVLSEGKVVGVYKKHHLPNYGVFDEKRYFLPGEDLILLKYGNAYVGVTVCEDMWIDNGPVKKLKDLGAELVLNLSASPYHFGKISFRRELIKKRAYENEMHVAFVNLTGGQDELVFDGGSMIAAYDGSVVREACYFSEDVIIADVELPENQREYSSSSELSVIEIAVKGSEGQTKEIEEVCSYSMTDEEEIYSALVLGLRDYVTKNGFGKVVIGLSGGIDSALTAAIAVDALGSENVTGITMPGPYSSQGSVDDSVELASNLGIEVHNVAVSGIYDEYIRTMKPLFPGTEHDVTEENVQARVRGNILMAFSNKYNAMVIATGNKSEMAVGYCTLYGDMAGGFAVLKDIYKTTVYRLSEFVNSKGEIRIPVNTISKAPSAELRPDQKDEDSLPPYDVLDNILKSLIEDDMSATDIISSGFDETTVRRVASMVYGNEYKRRQGPPGVKITPRAFGRDRRFPVTNKYRN